MRRQLRSLGPAASALRLTAADPDMGRLLVAWFAVNAGKWAFLVTNLVLAYEAGGTIAVGLLGLFRFLTPTILAPFAGLPTVRWRPEAVLRSTTAVRAGAIVMAIAAIDADLPIELLYVVVALGRERERSVVRSTWRCSRRSPALPASWWAPMSPPVPRKAWARSLAPPWRPC